MVGEDRTSDGGRQPFYSGCSAIGGWCRRRSRTRDDSSDHSAGDCPPSRPFGALTQHVRPGAERPSLLFPFRLFGVVAVCCGLWLGSWTPTKVPEKNRPSRPVFCCLAFRVLAGFRIVSQAIPGGCRARAQASRPAVTSTLHPTIPHRRFPNRRRLRCRTHPPTPLPVLVRPREPLRAHSGNRRHHNGR